MKFVGGGSTHKENLFPKPSELIEKEKKNYSA
jgi:hypothetical protein